MAKLSYRKVIVQVSIEQIVESLGLPQQEEIVGSHAGCDFKFVGRDMLFKFWDDSLPVEFETKEGNCITTISLETMRKIKGSGNGQT